MPNCKRVFLMKTDVLKVMHALLIVFKNGDIFKQCKNKELNKNIMFCVKRQKKTEHRERKQLIDSV